MRWALLLATILGLAFAGWVIGHAGVEPVLHAAGAIGWGGFLLLCLYTIGVLALLGLAWWVVTPGQTAGHIGLFIWARATREGATDVLPFSQFGGLVVGARTLTAAGLSSGLVYATIIADLTTEMAGQLIFTLYGIAMLAIRLAGGDAPASVFPLALAGLAATIGLLAAFAFFQRPMIDLAGRLAERVLPGSVIAARAVRAELDALYRRRGPISAGFLLNLAAWVASGGGAWLALTLMGVDISLINVLTIESLVFTLRSVAFMVPGAVGLQEGAYALLGPLFGLDPQTAIALSLLKRARDLALGVPALLLWQLSESRLLLKGAASPR